MQTLFPSRFSSFRCQAFSPNINFRPHWSFCNGTSQNSV